MLSSGYFWVRVFDYVHDRDVYEKGTMLDEFYLKDVAGGREAAKQTIRDRFCANTSGALRFAKPKKSDGLYAIVMDSDKFFYDRFYATIDTHCFWCHNPLRGKASEFPRAYIGDSEWYESSDNVFSDQNQTAYFCSFDCKAHLNNIRRSNEGEWQTKEEGQSGDVFGYIYLIYNREEDIHYIGQTRYLPFFRWQEHVKDGGKGDLSVLSFTTLAQVFRNRQLSDDKNQIYLNNIEAWWISKYEHEQQKVKNIMKPKITIEDLKQRFNDMVIRQEQLL